LQVTGDPTVTPRTAATAERTAGTGATHCLQVVTVTGVPPHLQPTVERTLIGTECLLQITEGMMTAERRGAVVTEGMMTAEQRGAVVTEGMMTADRRWAVVTEGMMTAIWRGAVVTEGMMRADRREAVVTERMTEVGITGVKADHLRAGELIKEGMTTAYRRGTVVTEVMTETRTTGVRAGHPTSREMIISSCPMEEEKNYYARRKIVSIALQMRAESAAIAFTPSTETSVF
jgi:hypothetical protein